jgi:polysaccharide deacetylase 2 family uncharacterized protein YibQ
VKRPTWPRPWAPPRLAPSRLPTIAAAAAIVLLAIVCGLAVWGSLVAPSAPIPEIETRLDQAAGPADPDLSPAEQAIESELAEAMEPSPAEVAETPETVVDPPSAPESETAPAAAGEDPALPAWQRFASPFPSADSRPRIAIVVTGLGLGETVTRAAIDGLPGTVTLSFSPYGERIGEWIEAARLKGHEALLDLPMEPISYPRDDPGPRGLLTSLGPDENAERLDWILGRAEGYVGVINSMGSRFLASETHMRPVLAALGRRGLAFVDGRESAQSLGARLASALGVPRAINDRFIDVEPTRIAIDGRLEQLERLALTGGIAVAVARPLPVTMERLRQWAGKLEAKGIALAPVSAILDRQPDR